MSEYSPNKGGDTYSSFPSSADNSPMHRRTKRALSIESDSSDNESNSDNGFNDTFADDWNEEDEVRPPPSKRRRHNTQPPPTTTTSTSTTTTSTSRAHSSSTHRLSKVKAGEIKSIVKTKIICSDFDLEEIDFYLVHREKGSCKISSLALNFRLSHCQCEHNTRKTPRLNTKRSSDCKAASAEIRTCRVKLYRLGFLRIIIKVLIRNAIISQPSEPIYWMVWNPTPSLSTPKEPVLFDKVTTNPLFTTIQMPLNLLIYVMMFG